MIFASVCSGIEAASTAWHPLGWRSSWLSEIDPFACSVLAHHYPTTPNLGDMTRIGASEIEAHDRPDVLVGGTPCQSFSVAGLRKGMADPRGNLALVFLRLLERTRARWVVWENVPGVLSSAGGRDFGAFLGALGQLGYGWAYRVLDAQYFGLAQRRKRVFVVGCAGGLTNRAAAVLFERACLRGDPAPSRETGARVAAALTRGADSGGKGGYAGRRQEDDVNVVSALDCQRGGPDDNAAQAGHLVCAEVAHAVTTHQAKAGDPTTDNYVAHSLRADGFDASEDGTGRGTPIVPMAYQCHGSNVGPMGTMRAGNGNEAGGVPFMPVAYALGSHAGAADGDVSNAPHASGGAVSMGISEECGHSLRAGRTQAIAFCGGHSDPISQVELAHPVTRCNGDPGMVAGERTGVRRLTPRECERLQGFPDDYTLVSHRGKPASDGPRYRALGNSMAVPVMAWIGRRIDLIERITS